MRQPPEFFGDQDLPLLYIAKRLNEAKGLEKLLDDAEVDYLIETDTYMGGFLFKRALTGAFFYVSDAQNEKARGAMRAAGYNPYDPGE
jgi:hypothetical protein